MKGFTLLSLIGLAFTTEAMADCFATKLGYPCCTVGTSTAYTDNDGKWGVENGNWCGIQSGSSSASCWAQAIGYPCCTSANTDVVYTDLDGKWGIENGNWCGIANGTNIPPTTTIPSQPTSPAGNMVDIAKNYMNKIKVTNTCPSNYSSKRNGVNYPKATKKSYFSKITNSNRQMNIILPANYNPQKQYPVVYVLHGIFGNEDSMLDSSMNIITISSNLLADNKGKEAIFVLPNEYAPAGGKNVNAALNQEYFDGYDNFINELTDVIMPYMEQNYSIAKGRENTAVCGFSMGGRNSLYIGYKRSDLFGYVAAFSPAPGVTPGTDFSGYHKGLFPQESQFQIKNPESETPFVTLVSCGTNDSVVGTFPKSYHEILTKNNQPHVWFEVPGADHDGKAVSAGFYNFMGAVFGELGL